MLIVTVKILLLFEYLDEMLRSSWLQVLISELLELLVSLLKLCVLILPLGIEGDYMLLVPHFEFWVRVSLFHLLQFSHVLVPLTLQEWILH